MERITFVSGVFRLSVKKLTIYSHGLWPWTALELSLPAHKSSSLPAGFPEHFRALENNPDAGPWLQAETVSPPDKDGVHLKKFRCDTEQQGSII